MYLASAQTWASNVAFARVQSFLHSAMLGMDSVFAPEDSSGSKEKICYLCTKDCSNEERVRDPNGYAHASCMKEKFGKTPTG